MENYAFFVLISALVFIELSVLVILINLIVLVDLIVYIIITVFVAFAICGVFMILVVLIAAFGTIFHNIPMNIAIFSFILKKSQLSAVDDVKCNLM